MYIELLTWDEICALPEFDKDEEQVDTFSTYWNIKKEREFALEYPDRIARLLHESPDSDGDYECPDFFYPACVIKQFIPDTQGYGEHKLLRRSSDVSV